MRTDEEKDPNSGKQNPASNSSEDLELTEEDKAYLRALRDWIK